MERITAPQFHITKGTTPSQPLSCEAVSKLLFFSTTSSVNKAKFHKSASARLALVSSNSHSHVQNRVRPIS
jgi:hypothetical protein